MVVEDEEEKKGTKYGWWVSSLEERRRRKRMIKYYNSLRIQRVLYQFDPLMWRTDTERTLFLKLKLCFPYIIPSNT